MAEYGPMNDVDIEMIELDNWADEEANETCLACGQVGQSITIPTADRGHELYECVCGHRAEWLRGRRLS